MVIANISCNSWNSVFWMMAGNWAMLSGDEYCHAVS